MQSPCRNLCALDAARARCTGCGRTIDEIIHWRSMTADQRAAVMARLAGRIGVAEERPAGQDQDRENERE